MDQDGYRSEELFDPPSSSNKDVLALDSSDGAGGNEASDDDIDMTDLFCLKRKSSCSSSRKLASKPKAVLKKGPTPLSSKSRKAPEVQSQAADLSALKDISSTLNQLVAHIENTEQEIKTLKRAVHSSPSSNSDATPCKEKLPVGVRVSNALSIE